MTFNNRLRKAMNIRNMKQVDLVEKTGISKSGISQYLSGDFTAKKENVLLIAEALNINPAWLMGLEVDMDLTKDVGIDTNSNELIQYIEENKEKLSSLSDEDSSKLKRFIELYLD